MEASIMERKGSSYVLNLPNLEATFRDLEREEIATIAIIGPACGGKYMIAAAIKSYLEKSFGTDTVLTSEEIFSLQPENSGLPRISVINKKVSFSRFHIPGKALLIISQIPRDMDRENARRLLFWSTALSSFQIFNIPNGMREWDRELIQTAKNWNSDLNSTETKQVIIVRDVLLPSYAKKRELFGNDTIDCYSLPVPGDGIFEQVPSATPDFRSVLTKFMKDAFRPESLASKKVEGRSVECSELLLFARELDPNNLTQSLSRVQNTVRVIHQYKKKMQEIAPGCLIDSAQLEKHHMAAKLAAMRIAAGETSEGKELEKEYARYKEAGRIIKIILGDLGVQFPGTPHITNVINVVADNINQMIVNQ